MSYRPYPDAVLRSTRHADWYRISVEIKGIKAIYHFKIEKPQRPINNGVISDPDFTEYYIIKEVRNGNYNERSDDISKDMKNKLWTQTAHFLENNTVSSKTEIDDRRQITDEELERLEALGYK
ncbi:hypothetical protein [Halorubrum pallidum]